MIYADTYSVPSYNAATMSATGLAVGNPSTNVITIGPGAVYQTRNISTSITDPIMKQALSVVTNTFTLVPPSTSGDSIIYTIQGTWIELSTSTALQNSLLPNLDYTNPFLPSTITHGELQLNMVAGAQAATGSQTPPAVSSGYFPIYYITLTYGSSVPSVTMAPVSAGAPYMKVTEQYLTPVVDSNTTLSVVNEMLAVTFPASSVSSVVLPIHSYVSKLNPYKPIYLKMSYAPSSSNTGTFLMRMRYLGYTIGTLTTATKTNTAADTITPGGTANAVADFVTVNAVIPNTAFAGWVSGVWQVNVETLAIVLEREGTSDTNTGSFQLLNVLLLQ